MTVVEQIHSATEVDARYAGYQRDTLTLTWEDRRQGHGRRRSDGGLEFAISLPNGTILKRRRLHDSGAGKDNRGG